MKRKIYILSVAVLGLFALAACSDNSPTGLPVSEGPNPVQTYQVVDGDTPGRGFDLPISIGSGNQSEMGYVNVVNDAQNLYLTFYMNGSWRILDSYLHFAKSYRDIPLDDANRPILDRFQYRFTLDRGMSMHNVVVPLSEIDARPGDSIVIASYATVYLEGENPDAPTRVGMGASWWNTVRYILRSGNGDAEIIRETSELSKREDFNL